MSCRPGGAVALLALCACGEPPDPFWLLDEEPRVLAFRVEVSEPGPLSTGFLPIPADRVRSEALPGDAVEVSAWVVSAEQEFETEALDPVWFLCPASGGCVSTFQLPGGDEPCSDHVPERAACRLAEGGVGRFSMPQLTPEQPLLDQYVVEIAMVGHVADDLTTEDCIDIVSDPYGPSWDGCIVGYHLMPMGPAVRLYQHAVETGIEVPVSLTPWELDVPAVPLYNPEITSLTLTPIFAGESMFGNEVADFSRSVEAWPGEVAVLEPGYVYGFTDGLDERDTQMSVEIAGDGISPEQVNPVLSVTTATPELIRSNRFGNPRLATPEEPATFSTHIVIRTGVRGADWATFEFEVREP